MIYKLKITAKDIKNMSRTILIDSESSFQKLHIYINKVFWFEAYHLYDFKYWEEFFINVPEEEEDEKNYSLWVSLLETEDEDEAKFDEVFDDELPKTKTYNAIQTKLSVIFDTMNIDRIDYVYDFWDYRDFDVSLIEKIIDANDTGKLPKLVASEWWYLIEDCWWPRWYNELLDMVVKKKYDDDLFETEEDFVEYIKPIQKKVILDK